MTDRVNEVDFLLRKYVGVGLGVALLVLVLLAMAGCGSRGGSFRSLRRPPSCSFQKRRRAAEKPK